MHWRIKAATQKAIAKLPERIGGPLYFQLQKNFGSANRVQDPSRLLWMSAGIVHAFHRQGRNIEGATCLEVGTGYSLSMPLGLWLCGAERIISVDVNPYLNEKLSIVGINWVIQNMDRVKEIFGELASSKIFNSRLSSLENIPLYIEAIKNQIGVKYCYPADARSLDLDQNSIDLHYSNNVLEHISTDGITGILAEAKRTLKPDGLLIHLVVSGDHFSHSDPGISSVNFLKYSEKKWNSIAGNRFMYQNRLRASEYLELYKEAGLHLLEKQILIDPVAKENLQAGMHLDEKFSGRDIDDLAAKVVNIVGTFNSLERKV